MTPFWIVNATLWTLLFLYVLPGAWAAAFSRKAHDDDPIRLAFGATAMMMGGFSYRWLFFPDSALVWQSLYVLSAALSIYLGLLARSFGRRS